MDYSKALENTSIPELIDWLQDVDTPDSVTPAQLAYIFRRIFSVVSVIEAMSSKDSVEIRKLVTEAVESASAAVDAVRQIGVVAENALMRAEQPARFFHRFVESLDNVTLRESTSNPATLAVWCKEQKRFFGYEPASPNIFFKSWPNVALFAREDGSAFNRALFLHVGSSEGSTVAIPYAMYGGDLIPLSDVSDQIADLGVKLNNRFNSLTSSLNNVSSAVNANSVKISTVETSVSSNRAELDAAIENLKPKEFAGIIDKNLNGLIVPSYKYGIPTKNYVEITAQSSLMPASEVWFSMELNAFVGVRGSGTSARYFTSWLGSDAYNTDEVGTLKARSDVQFVCGASSWKMTRSGFTPDGTVIIDYANFSKAPFRNGVPEFFEGFIVDSDFVEAIRSASSVKFISTNGTLTLPISQASTVDDQVAARTSVFAAQDGTSYYGMVSVDNNFEICVDFFKQ